MTSTPLRNAALAGLAAALVACSGSTGTPSRFPASSTLAQRCATPRAGTGDRQGTVDDEKAWLRSWTDELYLWYREVPDVDPAAYTTATEYFDTLKTDAVTASGHPKDRFHFTYSTAEWTALIQSGVDLGYGIQWAVLSPTIPREVVVAYRTTPTAAGGVTRGARLLFVDGADVVNGADPGDVAKINAGLFPGAAGEVHELVLQDAAGVTSSVTLTADAYASAPVQAVEAFDPGDGLGPVGYFLFTDHVATAESALVGAISTLKAAGITDLVLDLRYNGGGYIEIASELAYMIAGPGATTGRTFELTVFNDKYPGKDPVTGRTLTPIGFESRTQGFSLAAGQPLPTLTLPRNRVFVLTGPDTCSASESIINSLQGVGVQVVQIGAPTCGKPYGFYPQDNCGTTYFAIQFAGVNDRGFGSYSDGFTPGGTGDASPPGCVVADDFAHDLGDPSEARLAAALAYRAGPGTCPAAAVATSARALVMQRPAPEVVVPKSPLLTNRIVRM